MTINNGEALDSSGTLNLTGSDTIQTGVLDNTGTGQINVTGTGNAIDNETTFTNAGHIEVEANAALTLLGDTVTNTGGFITVDTGTPGGALTLTSTTINNGDFSTVPARSI